MTDQELIAALADVLRNILGGARDIDPRLKYLECQLYRDDLEEAGTLLAAVDAKYPELP